MKKIAIQALLILGITVNIYADVPYIFQPNTPAKANEVNDNFQALSDQIATLESNVSSITGGSNENNCDASPFTYSYSYVSSNIGDVITVAGIEYIIVAAPFLEYASGDHYYIKYPVNNSNFTANGFKLQTSTIYVSNDTSCYPYSFAGFPSTNNEISYSTRYFQWYGDIFSITNTASFQTTIKINQTELSLSWAFYENQSKVVSEKSYTLGDFDLTDNIDWSGLGVDNTLVDTTKTLLNYIEIVKIP